MRLESTPRDTQPERKPGGHCVNGLQRAAREV